VPEPLVLLHSHETISFCSIGVLPARGFNIFDDAGTVIVPGPAPTPSSFFNIQYFAETGSEEARRGGVKGDKRGGQRSSYARMYVWGSMDRETMQSEN
jgi:hypothetical protein